MSNFIKLLKEPLPSIREELEKEFREKYADDEDVLLIGFMNLFDSSFINESTLKDSLNFQGKVKTVTISIRPKEGWQKPHIHLENEKIHCAIRLDTPEYFIHGIYVDTLNNKQAKLFDEFMREGNGNISKWEIARNFFNQHFKNHKIKVINQPDYTKLNN